MKPADLVHQSFLAGPIDIQLLRDERLHDLFETAAQRAPLATAMTCAGQSISYGELQALTDRWSRSLRARGIQPGSKVGVWLSRSIALHAAVLAVLKAGATYLPFDDQAPAERVGTCLEDCGADLLLVDAGQAARAAGLSVETLDVAALDIAVDVAPPLRPAASQAAYIIYTSGSTGQPKGVAVSHANICHLVRAENSQLGVVETDIVYAGFSAAFDMSLEEVFIAYLAGACLAVATAEQAQQIDHLPDMLTQAGVTVLHCVPTLLALVDRDIPGLRLINFGGEACSQALVDTWWRPGRRLTNTYGPTEATVTATIAELRPGTPVTIGEPLPNYTALIVDESGRLVPPGAAGELCIGGPGVSLGYVNRPLLTAAAFVPVPGSISADLAYPIMYRTGDRATVDEHGQLHLHGRLDSQVKHRGFRIELGEIEAALTRLPGVRAAAVVLRGSGTDEHLAAFVVSAGFDQRSLRVGLGECLPSYMVPAAFHVLDALPRLPSGKVNRNALPDLPAPSDAVEADDPLLATLQSLFPHGRAGLQDDFFRDLGGHSLLAAAFVSRLRKLPRFARLSLQDLYELRTAERISARFDTAPPVAHTVERVPISRWRHALCTLAQAALLPFIFAIASTEFLLPYIVLDQSHDDFGWFKAVGLALGVFIAIPPATMAVAITAKWVVLGRVRPGRHRLWGFMYLRWWFVSRLQELVVRTVMADTPLMAAYYRLLGARIGKGVHLGDVGTGAHDLISIGAGSAIGSHTLFNTATVTGGWLIFGPVEIGANAHVGSACVLDPGTTIGDRGELSSLSCLRTGAVVPPGQLWSGSPAGPSGAAPVARPASTPSRWRVGAAVTSFSLIALLLVPVLHLLPMLPSLAALDMAQEAGPVRRDLILIAPVIALAYTLLVLLEVTILRWILLGRVMEGEHDTVSLFYVRKWTVDRLLDLSLAVLHPVFATLYVVPFFRALGAKVGAGAEISTAASVTHDLLEVGEGAFVADSVKLGDQEIRGGRLTLKRTVVGRRTFVGNSAFIPSGSHLPDDALVGCLSVPPAEIALIPGQACFGSPAIVLPSRQQSTRYDTRLTFRPSRWAIAQRLFIEAGRILLPRGAVFVAICFALDAFDTLPEDLGLPLALLMVPLLYVLYFVIPSVIGTAALKWLLVGRYRPAEYPLWSRPVWLTEAVTAIYEGLTVPLCLRHLRGTAFLPLALRLFGTRIGRRVWMNSTELTEFDLVTIGDEAELNQDGGPQTHLFEDRVMKTDRLVLGARSTLGPHSIALPGAQLQEGAQLGSLSLVMKGETIPSGPAWAGSPARCQE